MAILHIHLRDLPPERRAEIGAAMIRELRKNLVPGMPEAYRKDIEAKIARVTKVVKPEGAPKEAPPFWARAQAPQPPAPAPTAAPPFAKHHKVVVSETLSVDDKAK